MEQPTAENTWYAVAHVTVGQNADNCQIKIVMISQSQSIISESADLLNEQIGFHRKGLTVASASERLSDYIGEEFYATDKLVLDESMAKDYEKRGLIFGRPGFKPAFDCPNSEPGTDQRDTT